MDEFVIDVRDFDANLLPEGSRTPGTPAFQVAVVDWYAGRLSEIGGTALVSVDDERIVVHWSRDARAIDPEELGVSLLQEGKLREGVEVLQAVVALDPANTGARFNLGMAQSDLGELGEACKQLEKVVAKDSTFSHAWVALAVAQQRLGDSVQAKATLERALAVNPNDGYAHRNLGAVLMNLDAPAEAGHHFEEASRLLPDDLQALYGYALWLLEHDAARVGEADEVLIRVLELVPPGHPLEAAARQARSKLAMTTLRQVGGDVRMDAVMYLLGAMRRFRDMPRLKVQEVGFEVAMLGQRGLDVNDSAAKYHLRTFPGEYSGLHLMALMYASFKVIDPSLDIGFDLSREYAAAQSLFEQGVG